MRGAKVFKYGIEKKLETRNKWNYQFEIKYRHLRAEIN